MKKNITKRLLGLVLAGTLLVGGSLSVCAAPVAEPKVVQATPEQMTDITAFPNDPGDRTISIQGKSGHIYTYSLPANRWRTASATSPDAASNPFTNYEIPLGEKFKGNFIQAGRANEAFMMEYIRTVATGDFSRLNDICNIPECYVESIQIGYDITRATVATKGAPAGDFKMILVDGLSSGVGIARYLYTMTDSNWGKFDVIIEVDATDIDSIIVNDLLLDFNY